MRVKNAGPWMTACLLSGGLLMSGLQANADDHEEAQHDWENQNVIGINKEDPHVTLMP